MLLLVFEMRDECDTCDECIVLLAVYCSLELDRLPSSKLLKFILTSNQLSVSSTPSRLNHTVFTGPTN